MKKSIVLLLMATFAFAYISKAQDVELKNPYVDYPIKPNLTADQKIANFKLAIQGKEIVGAKVNADAADYKAPWGDRLYNAVLTANNSDFHIGKSVGGEQNWGIATNGVAGPTGGVLPAGVETIWLGNIEIAKIGTNYCYNALPPFKLSSGDPDEVAYVAPTKPTPAITNPGYGNTNTINVNSGPNHQIQELSYREGIKIFAEGANFYADVQRETVSLLRQNPLGCCGNSGSSTVAPTMYTTATPAMYTVPVAQPASYSGNSTITVREKANGWDIANTVLYAANTAFNGINTFRGYRFDNPTVRGYNSLNNYYNPNPTGGYFQGSNQQGGIRTTGSGGGTYDNGQYW